MVALSEFKSPYPPVHIPQISYYQYLVSHGSESGYSPDTPAQIDGITGETRTRGQLEQECLLFASGFRNAEQKGLEKLGRGSVIVMFSPNGILYSLMQLAMVSSYSTHNTRRYSVIDCGSHRVQPE